MNLQYFFKWSHYLSFFPLQGLEELGHSIEHIGVRKRTKLFWGGQSLSRHYWLYTFPTLRRPEHQNEEHVKRMSWEGDLYLTCSACSSL
jgi:hypothetical protein